MTELNEQSGSEFRKYNNLVLVLSSSKQFHSSPTCALNLELRNAIAVPGERGGGEEEEEREEEEKEEEEKNGKEEEEEELLCSLWQAASCSIGQYTDFSKYFSLYRSHLAQWLEWVCNSATTLDLKIRETTLHVYFRIS